MHVVLPHVGRMQHPRLVRSNRAYGSEDKFAFLRRQADGATDHSESGRAKAVSIGRQERGAPDVVTRVH